MIPSDIARKMEIGHNRYEVFRKLKPVEFYDLWSRKISGENFDVMIDEIYEKKKTV